MTRKKTLDVDIIDTDKFLNMPQGAQALYFHLALRADNVGFVNNPKEIQNLINVSDDNVKILIKKKFIKMFKTGIVIAAH